MFSFTLEFEDEATARTAAQRLLRQKITGEVTTRPLPGGGWLLAVDSERKLPDAWLKTLEGTAAEASG